MKDLKLKKKVLSQSPKRIRTRLIIFSILLAILPLLALSLFIYSQVRTMLIQDVFRELHSIADIQEQRVSEFAERHNERLEGLASRTQLRLSLKEYLSSRDPSEKAKLQRILNDAKNSIADFTQIAILDPQGEVVLTTGSFAKRSDPFQQIVSEKPSERIFAIKKDSSGEKRIYLSAPLVLNEAFLGRVMIEASLKTLNELITGYQGLGKSGEILLALKNTQGEAEFITPRKYEYLQEALKSVPQERLDIPITHALRGEEADFTSLIDYRGEPVLSVTRYLEDLGWGIVVKVDKSFVVERLNDLRIIVFISMALIMAIAGFFALRISQSILLPLEKLTDITRHIAEGQQDIRLSKEVTERQDEIGDLARSFLEMTKRLFKAHNSLEKQVEERTKALKESNQELEQFAYVASHDLQEPLRKITGFTQIINEKYRERLDDQADKYLKYIVDGANRMKTLINDLLTYSRSGRKEFKMGSVDLNHTINEVCDLLSSQIEESGAQVDVGDLPRVWGDRAQLSRVFQNLISNGIKYQKDHQPKISITAEVNDDECIISVKDNGIGIDPQYAQKVFEIFERLHNKDDYSGTGIGLAVCRRIIERHGGRIYLESGQEQGSVFKVVLPTAKKGKTYGVSTRTGERIAHRG